MPRPTPVKIAPLASPRRADGTCGSTAGAASTISTPPAKPEAKRQTKNHPKESGIAEAKKVARSKRHHRAQHGRRGTGARHRLRRQRASEIAGEVRGTQIGGLGGREPLRVDQRRDERRVGKAREADADQHGAQARKRGVQRTDLVAGCGIGPIHRCARLGPRADREKRFCRIAAISNRDGYSAAAA